MTRRMVAIQAPMTEPGSARRRRAYAVAWSAAPPSVVFALLTDVTTWTRWAEVTARHAVLDPGLGWLVARILARVTRRLAAAAETS